MRFNLKQINIRNAFLAFDNFKQDFITAEHIKGIGTAEIEMKATWDSGFIFKEEELEVEKILQYLLLLKVKENNSFYI